jgi:cysteine desulfurase
MYVNCVTNSLAMIELQMANDRPIYLDCNATTPIEPEVLELMNHYFRIEYGNAGSRTHRYGTAAAQAVRRAREQVAAVVDANWENVLFTSGATESNNLAILGLAAQAQKLGKTHIISTQIEHKAVLEPLAELASRGFDVTFVPPSAGGHVSAEQIRSALRQDTFLVSVMQVNNETGVIQPIAEIADALLGHAAVFHTDAAQGFGKELDGLRLPRLDAISVSAHKIFGPKGVGALIVRQTERTAGLAPLSFGGGQERGLRPGTLPVPLIAGFGLASELSLKNHEARRAKCIAFRSKLLSELAPLQPIIVGDADRTLPHVINLRFGEIDSEALMIALRNAVSISNGSACTSNVYRPSHVLRAMGLSDSETEAATRWSWCHLTPMPRWSVVSKIIRSLT